MVTRVLLDTNILIAREDYEIISINLQNLLKILNNQEYEVLIHPLSIEEIERDSNIKRKKITLSKLSTYKKINKPPLFEKDKNFLDKIPFKENNHDYVDNSLIYSVYSEEVNFLITEDLGIHKKMDKLGLNNQVLNIEDAVNALNIELPMTPSTIVRNTADKLDINDPIFKTLREDYEEFRTWFKKIQNQRRDCLYYIENKFIGALLIYKDECETLELKNKVLPPKKRVKIATFVVTSNGNKIGEFFISWIVKYALDKKMDEIYLTHFLKENDSLEYLIEQYGFENVGTNSREESIFIKNINQNDINSIKSKGELNALEFAEKFYPYYCDNETIRKFIIPIKPEYHQKLFFEDNHQQTLENFTGNSYYEYPEDYRLHNTIKKAYLSHANANLRPGDLILFYESDKKGISNIGVVEKYEKTEDYKKVIELISKRSVYSNEEIKKLLNQKLSVLLFIYCKNFDKIDYNTLMDNEIIHSPPQSIQTLNHENYLKIKRLIEK